MVMRRPIGFTGFSLIELLVMIIVVGILATVAMQSMTALVTDSRRMETEGEMGMLAAGIAGDPRLMQDGIRSDFGYVGDVGAFPPNIEALLKNPGLGTWRGPYIGSKYLEDNTSLVIDAWGSPYSYDGATAITSTGSGSSITRRLPGSNDDYLRNSLEAHIADINDSLPGVTYADSVNVTIAVPNGAGGINSRLYHPAPDGIVSIDSLPIGVHPVLVVFEPMADTLRRNVTILPRHKSTPPPVWRFARSCFSDAGPSGGSSGLVYVDGTVSAGDGHSCNAVTFDIRNAGDQPVVVSSVTLTWAIPEAYYSRVRLDNSTLVNSSSNRIGSGEPANFTSPQALQAGDVVTVTVDGFKRTATGGGGNADVDMNDVTFSIQFSDGSSFDVTTGACQN
jgi:type II secretory pathway pseudopilin PulG